MTCVISIITNQSLLNTRYPSVEELICKAHRMVWSIEGRRASPTIDVPSDNDKVSTVIHQGLSALCLFGNMKVLVLPTLLGCGCGVR
jgi:hypothetical protein